MRCLEEFNAAPSAVRPPAAPKIAPSTKRNPPMAKSLPDPNKHELRPFHLGLCRAAPRPWQKHPGEGSGRQPQGRGKEERNESMQCLRRAAYGGSRIYGFPDA